eukprot:CAMPEP_0185168794 /NCGR_PEP_ID=MMETSP1139-20130426/16402_1 /TAXON_ID=298111 /ORGANISM="Pavlova sp., Strain CCMP459" /LENGTH=242 /DNA_ID=CAMNT_0027734313 /DNA_START=28 /DNA_END=756 /DNA_ORIENTATION=-
MDEWSWTNPLTRTMLASTSMMLRPVLRVAAYELRNFRQTGHTDTFTVSTPFVRGVYNVTNVTLAGVDTLEDFRAVADDAEHFNITSSLGSLTSSMVINAQMRLGLGPVASPPVSAQFVLVTHMSHVSLVTRWHSRLKASEYLPKWSTIAHMRVRQLPSQVIAMLPQIVDVDVYVRGSVLSVRATEADPNSLRTPAPVLWRLTSAIFRKQVLAMTEASLADTVYDNLRVRNFGGMHGDDHPRS